MNEDFLQFIWKNKLYNQQHMKTEDGENFYVLKPGFHNTDAGPDFIDARIQIGDTLWAGNVEVHNKSSDWNKHKHATDDAYNNVILHVVHEHDEDIFTHANRKLPVFVLAFDRQLFDNYNALLFGQSVILCSEKLAQIDNFKIKIWLDRVLVHRLERKSDDFLQHLKKANNSWEEAFYVQIAKSFGLKTNALPFEMLARSIPLTILARHKNALFQIESLLFGQAGFLVEETGDAYYQKLRKEYLFLRHKYQLHPIENHLWKFLRLRPANFPTIRIAQFAYLVHKSQGLFSQVIEAESATQLFEFFDVKTSDYWEKHYTFNEESKKQKKKLGKQSVINIFINTVVPVLFVYGEEKGNELLKERALELLEALPGEKNSIIEKWKQLHIETNNASDSQALIELYNQYCKPQKCLHCDLGREVITKYEQGNQ